VSNHNLNLYNAFRALFCPANDPLTRLVAHDFSLDRRPGFHYVEGTIQTLTREGSIEHELQQDKTCDRGPQETREKDRASFRFAASAVRAVRAREVLPVLLSRNRPSTQQTGL
jgi:hypothetical protein